jgi:hypothetical protein
VRSSSLKEQAENRIEQDLDSTEEDLMDAVDQLGDRSFACEEDATEAAAEWLADHDDSPGRPPKDWDPYKTVYKLLSRYSEIKKQSRHGSSAKAALC